VLLVPHVGVGYDGHLLQHNSKLGTTSVVNWAFDMMDTCLQQDASRKLGNVSVVDCVAGGCGRRHV
jgi:hypothetical protein